MKNPDANGVCENTGESIEHWMNETNEMSKIDFNHLIVDYPKSVAMASKQRERQLKISEKYIIPALQMKTTKKESMTKLTAEMKHEQTEMDQVNLKLTNVNNMHLRVMHGYENVIDSCLFMISHLVTHLNRQ